MTDVALKEYLDRRVDDLDKRIDQRIHDLEGRLDQEFKLRDVAISKAETAIGERLGTMNEMRGALSDLSRTKASQDAFGGLAETVNQIRRDKANLDGRLLILSVGGSVVVNWILFHWIAK